MTIVVTKMEVYLRVLRDTVRAAADDEAVLWIMQVLHSHRLRVRRDVVVEDVVLPAGEDAVVLWPLTRSHVADLVASLFSPDDPRCRSAYWGMRFDVEAGYEAFVDVPTELRSRAEAARRAVAAHELVEEVFPD